MDTLAVDQGALLRLECGSFSDPLLGPLAASLPTAATEAEAAPPKNGSPPDASRSLKRRADLI